MQAIKEAVLLQFQGNLVSYKATHNKIIYRTTNKIVVVSVQIDYKQSHIQIGQQLITYSVGDKNEIALLFKNGTLQIRHLDDIQTLIRRITIDISSSIPKLHWHSNSLYLFYQHQIDHYQACSSTTTTYLSIAEPECLIDGVISNMSNIMVLHLQDGVALSAWDNVIMKLHINDVKSVQLLSSPIYEQSNEYVVLNIAHRLISIYTLKTFTPILSINLGLLHSSIIISYDIFKQYMLIKTYNSSIVSSILFGINPQIYTVDTNLQQNDFFLYEMNLNVLQELKMFPSKREIQHKGIQCKEIGMCYISKVRINWYEIKILSILVSNHYCNRPNYVKYYPSNQTRLTNYSQINQFKQAYNKQKQYDQIPNCPISILNQEIPSHSGDKIQTFQQGQKDFSTIFDQFLNAQKFLQKFSRLFSQSELVGLSNDQFLFQKLIQMIQQLSMADSKGELQQDINTQEIGKNIQGEKITNKADQNDKLEGSEMNREERKLSQQSELNKLGNESVEINSDQQIQIMSEDSLMQESEVSSESSEYGIAHQMGVEIVQGDRQLRAIQQMIERAFSPLQNKLNQLDGQITRLDGIMRYGAKYFQYNLNNSVDETINVNQHIEQQSTKLLNSLSQYMMHQFTNLRVLIHVKKDADETIEGKSMIMHINQEADRLQSKRIKLQEALNRLQPI